MKSSVRRPLALGLLLALINSFTVNAGEIHSTQADQTSLAITIYNSNLALVKDRRTIELTKGEQDLAFMEVSALIQPETAILTSLEQPGELTLLEQNFDFDLLSPQSLLNAYIGKEVRVIKTHPTTGAETTVTALVLATHDGTVLKIGDQIETGVPGRIVFDQIPENFRERPTLVMTLNHDASAKKRKLELSYLTQGLSWEADYVALLSEDETSLDLNGWVTLSNQSGIAYHNAKVQLVAGDVNIVKPKQRRMRLERAMISSDHAKMEDEALFDYHLYTLGHPTTIANKQTKQVALMSASEVRVVKTYVLRGQQYVYHNPLPSPLTDIKVAIELSFKNDSASQLGLALPKGTVRLYKNDRSGGSQFIGEDRIDHTPENKRVKLSPGNAFDITATKAQRIVKRKAASRPYSSITESEITINIENAKDKSITVRIEEPFPGEWKIIGGEKPSEHIGQTALWHIEVPAKGKAELVFQVRVKI